MHFACVCLPSWFGLEFYVIQGKIGDTVTQLMMIIKENEKISCCRHVHESRNRYAFTLTKTNYKPAEGRLSVCEGVEKKKGG